MLLRSILEIQDSVLTIPGHDVSFFPDSSPRLPKGDLGGFKLKACLATWTLLLDGHDLRVSG